MSIPTCLFFHIPGNEEEGDYTVRLDKDSSTLHIQSCPRGEQDSCRLPLRMAYELAQIIVDGMTILEPKSHPIIAEGTFPIPDVAPGALRRISPAEKAGDEKWEDKMAKLNAQSYAGSPLLDSQKDYQPQPFNHLDVQKPVVASGPSDDYDDPTKVWCIRHEHKDLWFTTNDMTGDTRECTGRRPMDAHCFPTKYSAHRFMQNFKQGNPVTLLEFEAAYIVYYQETPQSKRFYASKHGATSNPFEAQKMAHSQAQASLEAISDSFIKGIEKVRA